MNGTRKVVLVAVDDTPAADEVLGFALEAARGLGATELHLIYVAEPPIVDELQIIRLSGLLEEGRAILERLAKRAGEQFGGRVEGHVGVDLVTTGILQVATDIEADLIVVGSHGKTRLQRMMLGSVARAVVARAHCAVLVARRADYPSSHVPEIEPACPRCVDLQRRTAGAALWCEEHSRRALEPHLHYHGAERFAVGSGLLRPPGSGL